MATDNQENFNERWDERFNDRMDALGFEVADEQGRKNTRANNAYIDQRRRRTEKTAESTRTWVWSIVGIVTTAILTSVAPHLPNILREIFN